MMEPSISVEDDSYQSSEEEISTLESAALMECRKQLRLGSINSLQRSVRHVKRYNVLFAGESRLGKSTIIQQLLQTQRISKAKNSPTDNKETASLGGFSCRKESQIETMMLKHKRSKLVLSLIETPGFGPSSMGPDCWQPVMDEIKGRINKYMSEENSITRRIVTDHRIHCCIYFLSPFACGLRPVDIEFLKNTCRLVNIIPVIAKVDTMTTQECKKLKMKILEDCEKHGISLFNPDMFDLPDNITLPPYSVIGGDTQLYDEEGHLRIGRQYPWGFAEVHNEGHCDYVTLHDIILRSCIEDLIEYTDTTLYENYRTDHLRSLDLNSSIDLSLNSLGGGGVSPVSEKERLLQEKQFELERLKRHLEQMSRRMPEQEPLMEMSCSDRDSILSSASSNRSAEMKEPETEPIPETTI